MFQFYPWNLYQDIILGLICFVFKMWGTNLFYFKNKEKKFCFLKCKGWSISFLFFFFFGEKSFYTREGYCPNLYGLLSVCLVITPAPSPPLPSKVKDILTVQDILCWIHCYNKHMIFILYLFFKYCYCLYPQIFVIP